MPPRAPGCAPWAFSVVGSTVSRLGRLVFRRREGFGAGVSAGATAAACGGLLRLLRRRGLGLGLRPSSGAGLTGAASASAGCFARLGRVRRRASGIGGRGGWAAGDWRGVAAGAAGGAAAQVDRRDVGCRRRRRRGASSGATAGIGVQPAPKSIVTVAATAIASVSPLGFGGVFRRGVSVSAVAPRRLRGTRCGLGEHGEFLGGLQRRVGRDRGAFVFRLDGSENWPFLACRVSGAAAGLSELFSAGASRTSACRAGRFGWRAALGRAGRIVPLGAADSPLGAVGALRALGPRGARRLGTCRDGLERVLGLADGRPAPGADSGRRGRGDRVRRDFGQGRFLSGRSNTGRLQAAGHPTAGINDENQYVAKDCGGRGSRHGIACRGPATTAGPIRTGAAALRPAGRLIGICAMLEQPRPRRPAAGHARRRRHVGRRRFLGHGRAAQGRGL